MEQKVVQLFNRGMSRDTSISKAETEFAFENHNVRVLARDHDSLLSVTNERGNKEVEDLEFAGTLIGWNTLNEYLILFTVDSDSHIYRVKYEDDEFSSIEIFSGDLGFDAKHPIESITDYENDDILKIYWIDGINILRSMNFSDTYLQKHQIDGGYDFAGKTDWFDSNRGSASVPKVTIEKTYDGEQRQNGVIQYFITYYNKNGVQTAPVYSSPLVYLAPLEGSNSADGMNTVRVTLKIESVDNDFDRVRVYAVMRTSLGITNSAFIVGDAAINSNKAIVIDSGSNLEPIDVTSLLFLGNKSVKAGTMTNKDGTLFLGDLDSIGNEDVENIKTKINDNAFVGGSFVDGISWESAVVSFEYSTGSDNIPYANPSGLYPMNNQLQYPSYQISTFKGGEKYRFAIRFIKSNGDRSQAFWIGDKVNPLYPRITGSNSIQRAMAVCRLPDAIVEAADAAGYVSAQLMVAKAMYSDRSVKAQGILSPTMFNLHSRFNDMPFAQSSWMYRFNGSKYAHQHFDTPSRSDVVTAEIQNSWWGDTVTDPSPLYIVNDSTGDIANQPEGHKLYEGIVITCTVKLNMWHKYTGTMTIEYYTLNDSTFVLVPEATRTVTLGGRYADNRSKLKLIADWLQAYEDEGVEYEHRKTQEQIEYFLRDMAYSSTRVDRYPSTAGAVAQIDYSTSNIQRRFSNESREFYFVDSNIVTLNSPEIEYEAVNLDKNRGLKLRIVGAARITGNISDYKMVAEDFEFVGTRVTDINLSTPNISDNTKAITARPIYTEYDVVKVPGETQDDPEEEKRSESPYGYMMYMWHKSGSIPGATLDGKKLSILKTKMFANLNFSYYSIYNNYLENKWDRDILDIRQFNSLAGQVYELNTQYGKKIYGANIDDVIIKNGISEYPIWRTTEYGADYDEVHLEHDEDHASTDPVHMTYDSRAHAVVSLNEEILPYIFESDKYAQIQPDSGQSGPFAPWEERSVSDSETSDGFMYRECVSSEEGDQEDFNVGLFSGFDLISSDGSRMTISKELNNEGSTPESIRAVVDKIRHKGITEPVYVMMNVEDGNGDEELRLADMSRCEITDIEINANYTHLNDGSHKLNFAATSSGAKIKSITYNVILYNRTASNYYSVSDGRTYPESNTGVYPFEMLVIWNYLVGTIQVGVTVEFYNTNISTLVLSGAESILMGSADNTNASGSIKKTWWFYGDKIKYLALPEDDESYTFINIFDNRYIEVGPENYTLGDRDSGVEYTAPKQEAYTLKSPLLDENSQYAFIGELYHDYDSGPLSDDNRYGGISVTAVEGNTFIPAGAPSQIVDATEVPTYATSTLECDELYRLLMESSGTNSVRIELYATGDPAEKVETIFINGLSDFNIYDTLPTENSKMTLIVKEVEGLWYTDALEGTMTAAQKDAIADPDNGYRVLMMRMGYARRGKWRKYINKFGEEQTSHTTRTPEFRYKRKGVSNKLDAYRLRFLGQDMIMHPDPVDPDDPQYEEKTKWMHSSTWKTGGSRVTYTQEMVMANFGGQVILPDPDNLRSYPTRDGHIPNRSRDGLAELFIAMYHREGKDWKRVSNIVQVRGRNADRTKMWEFTPENEFVPGEE